MLPAALKLLLRHEALWLLRYISTASKRKCSHRMAGTGNCSLLLSRVSTPPAAVFSGYSSIVAAEVLYQLRTDNLCAAEPEVRDWAHFEEYMNSNEPAWPKAPFLWAGFILESDVANVYVRQDDGEKPSLRVEAHLEQTD